MMVDETLQKLADLAREKLKPKRYLHVVGVAHTATALAARHGHDPVPAAMAAWLHDLSKPMHPNDIEADLKSRGVKIPKEDRDFPALWHGLHAATLARQDFRPWLGKQADEIAEAVELHSTADREAKPLTKIIFLADTLEPGRDYDGIEELRKAARKDLDRGFALTVERKCQRMEKKGDALSPRAKRAFEYYVERKQSS